jgi:hypothetical protein
MISDLPGNISSMLHVAFSNAKIQDPYSSNVSKPSAQTCFNSSQSAYIENRILQRRESRETIISVHISQQTMAPNALIHFKSLFQR